jgi:F5/8 type C domain/Fibronectin type III domain
LQIKSRYLPVALLVAFSPLAFAAGAWSTSASAATGPDLALGRPVVASSVFSSSYPASNAVDSSLSTRWSSAFSDPQWIYVDLGGTFTIKEVALDWETAYAKAYKIQVSNDASNWTTLYSTTTANGGVNDLTGISGTGRYVRLYGTARATAWGYSLWNFAVYGTASGSATASPTAPANLAATPGDGQIGLSWNPSTESGGSIGGYYVYRNGVRIGNVPSGTSYTDAGLTNGTSYSFYVEAYDASGNVSTPSSTITATPSGASFGGAGATVSANPSGPAVPSGGWTAEYADAFGATSKYNGGTDNTYWPDSWIGDTGNDAGANSNEMEVYNPSKVTVDSNGLNLACTYTPGVASGKNYTCGEINIGIGGNSKPLTEPGYKFFSYRPGAGQEWAVQYTAELPQTTGEEDPAVWSTDVAWSWEWDMPEFWGWWSAGGWCSNAAGMSWFTNGSIQHQWWDYPCAKWGFDPSTGYHTYTMVMLTNNTIQWYVDGKLITSHSNGSTSGTVTAAAHSGGVWIQHALRNILNNGANFKSGSRSFHVRSLVVYENTSAGNANTTNAPLIAPGTRVQ